MPDRELPLGRIGVAAGAFALAVAGAVAGVLWWLHASALAPGGERLARGYDLVVPGPNLQPAPQPDLRAYRAEKGRLLHGGGWVDAGRGVARIPIGDAMALLAAASAASAAPPLAGDAGTAVTDEGHAAARAARRPPAPGAMAAPARSPSPAPALPGVPPAPASPGAPPAAARPGTLPAPAASRVLPEAALPGTAPALAPLPAAAGSAKERP